MMTYFTVEEMKIINDVGYSFEEYDGLDEPIIAQYYLPDHNIRLFIQDSYIDIWKITSLIAVIRLDKP